jgi:hypothetical protein
LVLQANVSQNAAVTWDVVQGSLQLSSENLDLGPQGRLLIIKENVLKDSIRIRVTGRYSISKQSLLTYQ